MLRRVFSMILLVSVLLPTLAQAVGLGNIQILSAINQPLNAQIEILSLDKVPLNKVHAALATPAEFKNARMVRSDVLQQIQFNVTRNKQQQAVIQLSSKQAIEDPYLQFLVTLTWPNGNTTREYTLLLQPQNYKTEFLPQQEILGPSIPGVPKPSKSIKVPRQSVKPGEAPTPSSSLLGPSELDMATVTRLTQQVGRQYGPTTRKDSLWRIAHQVRDDNSITIPQVMYSILIANPHAFVGKNVNGLLPGKVLNIPQTQEMTKVPKSMASAAIKSQDKTWQQRASNHIKTSAKPQPARTDLTRLIKGVPNDVLGKIAYAHQLAQQGKDQQAAEVLRDALKNANPNQQTTIIESLEQLT